MSAAQSRVSSGSGAPQEPNHNQVELMRGHNEDRHNAEAPAQPQQQQQQIIPMNSPLQHDQPNPLYTPLHDTVLHIGWVSQSHDSSFALEKDFRALRSWLSSPRSWQYDFEYIRNSLRMGCQSRVFWFPDIGKEPWAARDPYAIAGAVEYMLRAGREVCFFVASRPEPVGALSLEQRALERSAQFVELGRMGPVGR